MQLNLIMAAGLSEVTGMFIRDWAGPAFLIIIVAVSVKFATSRQFRELASLIVFAAIVGTFIYTPGIWFGESGVFTGIAKMFGQELDSGGGSGGAANTIRHLMGWLK